MFADRGNRSSADRRGRTQPRELIEHGPADRVCPACGSLNASWRRFCAGCDIRLETLPAPEASLAALLQGRQILRRPRPELAAEADEASESNPGQTGHRWSQRPWPRGDESAKARAKAAADRAKEAVRARRSRRAALLRRMADVPRSAMRKRAAGFALAVMGGVTIFAIMVLTVRSPDRGAHGVATSSPLRSASSAPTVATYPQRLSIQGLAAGPQIELAGGQPTPAVRPPVKASPHRPVARTSGHSHAHVARTHGRHGLQSAHRRGPSGARRAHRITAHAAAHPAKPRLIHATGRPKLLPITTSARGHPDYRARHHATRLHRCPAGEHPAGRRVNGGWQCAS